MFSSTAYEAMYRYIGLALHERFIEVITSQRVFMGAITLIFGFMFFVTSVEFFSRYIPGALIKRRQVPLSRHVKIIFFLFLGLGVLRVGSQTSVKRFNGESWHENPYVHNKVPGVAPQYKVSFIFDVLSRTAEEIAALMSRVIDSTFKVSHSQLDAPDFFFKAIMYAGAETIEDPRLKKTVQFYTEECFDRVIPFMKDNVKKLDGGMFQPNAQLDAKLAQVYLERADKKPYNCLDVKNELSTQLYAYAQKTTGGGGLLDKVKAFLSKPGDKAFQNYHASNLLANYYLDQRESTFGVQKGALAGMGSDGPTGASASRGLQYFNRLFSWDGLLSIFSGGHLHGAAEAASRAQEFSENLARAPHVAGFIKMLAIASFPWLIFFVVAGYWRVLVYWFFIYLSVCLWAPIWTLLYHIMNGIAFSSDVIQAWERLGDGVSLYGAKLISSRIYYLYSVYSWLQLLTGTLFTAMVLYFMRPVLSESKEETAPEGIDGARSVAAGVGKVVA